MKEGTIQKQLQQRGGSLRRYRRAVVGDGGLLLFVLYELAAMCFMPLPGRFGVLMRRVLLPFLFEGFGKGVMIRQNVGFRHPRKIRIGNGVVIEEGVSLDVKNGTGRIEIGDNVRLGRDAILSCPGGALVIRENTRIGRGCRIGSLKGVSIGRNCVVDNFACIIGAGHAFSSLAVPIIEQPLTCRGKTVIGDHVTIGRRATLLDGVSVAGHVVIAPNTLVTRNLDSPPE
jgi:acetyltransferase-like isoleucine patch superfamily enzyme